MKLSMKAGDTRRRSIKLCGIISNRINVHFRVIFDAIRELMRPPEPNKRPIGFLVEEPKVPYIIKVKRES